MKRLSAILFLSILLFNFYGYQLLINRLQYSEEARLEKKLDASEYGTNDLISIKTPLHLPYYTNSVSYERVYGSVNVNGVDYEYVKRRVYQDTLELLCLPNKAKTNLQSVKNDFVKMSLDGTPIHKKGAGHNPIKISLPDFYQENSTSISSVGIAPGKNYSPLYHAIPAAGYGCRQERPPQSLLLHS